VNRYSGSTRVSMISVQQAEALILQAVCPVQAVESVNLLEALHRVLAAPIAGGLDFPAWDNAAMDGYAVRSADIQAATADHPISLEIGAEIPAGCQPQAGIHPGQAARIFTGAMMPAGADAVVMQEDAVRRGNCVEIRTAAKPQAFVRQRGAFYRAGSVLLPAGTVLQATEIAVLAAAQCATVPVYRRPRVAILSTGDELVEIDQPLQPGQIVDSNRYALAALIQQMGAEPIFLGIIPDRPQALKQAIRAIATDRSITQTLPTVDVILSSGGVSVGDYDYVDGILAELGAEIRIHAVAMKPGKPLTFAVLGNSGSPPTLYFGLPGNPASALVTFWRLVQPALRKLSGRRDGWGPPLVNARSCRELRSQGNRETYLWGRVALRDGNYEFTPVEGGHNSGNLINLAGTNGLAILPVGQTHVDGDRPVQVMLVG